MTEIDWTQMYAYICPSQQLQTKKIDTNDIEFLNTYTPRNSYESFFVQSLKYFH